MYNSQTWGLIVNDEHSLDSFHRQQPRTAVHIKFPHVTSNNEIYQQTNEIPLDFENIEKQMETLWENSPSTNTSSTVNETLFRTISE